MTDRSTQLQTLSTQLAHELTLLRQLYDILLQEHRFLADKALDELTATVGTKSQLLDEFDAAVTARMATLTALGLDTQSDTPSATRQLIETCATEVPEIAQYWSELEELLGQCQEQNAINGAVIEISSHSLQTAYAILTASDSNKTDLYNAKGISRKGGGTGNSLAKA